MGLEALFACGFPGFFPGHVLMVFRFVLLFPFMASVD
jgi:hypothetical protein